MIVAEFRTKDGQHVRVRPVPGEPEATLWIGNQCVAVLTDDEARRLTDALAEAIHR